MLTDGRLTHGWLVQGPFSKTVLISEMVSRTAWARAGPVWAHTDPYGRLWAQDVLMWARLGQKGSVLTICRCLLSVGAVTGSLLGLFADVWCSC